MMLALLKDIWNVWFPIHHPYCRVCGRRVEGYIVEEGLRTRVTGGLLELLCFRHFDRMARRKGIREVFHVTAPEREWPANELSEV